MILTVHTQRYGSHLQELLLAAPVGCIGSLKHAAINIYSIMAELDINFHYPYNGVEEGGI